MPTCRRLHFQQRRSTNDNGASALDYSHKIILDRRQMYPEAVFKENQLILNLNARFSPNFSVVGLLQLQRCRRRYRDCIELLQFEPGLRRLRCEKNMIFLMGNYTGPWKIRSIHFSLHSQAAIQHYH